MPTLGSLALLLFILHVSCAQYNVNISEIWPKLPKKIRHQQHKVPGGLRIISSPATHNELAEMNMYLLIPKDPYYLPSFYKVAPGIKLAVEKIQEQGILPNHAIHVTYRDTQCSNSYAPAEAVEAYKDDTAHVFLGPTCEYALAPVARLVRFWNLPLLTAGGLTKDFAGDKTTNASEYFLLTRTGYTFMGYARTITTFMKNNSWRKTKLMYESNAYSEVTGEKTCYLTMSSLVQVLKEEKLSFNSYDLEKDPDMTVEQYMRKEIGNEYGGKMLFIFGRHPTPQENNCVCHHRFTYCNELTRT